jgi:hypothetical protein
MSRSRSTRTAWPFEQIAVASKSSGNGPDERPPVPPGKPRPAPVKEPPDRPQQDPDPTPIDDPRPPKPEKLAEFRRLAASSAKTLR